MNKLFNLSMSSSEARKVLFSSVEGKTEAEIREIKHEFSQIAPKIMERELRANNGFMTSDKL